MRDHFDDHDLLTEAAAVLRYELLPLLPDSARPEALHVLQALEIARRASQDVEDADRAELMALSRVLAAPPPPDDLCLQDIRGALHALSRQLATRIRRGDFDPGTARHREVQQYLAVATGRKVQESSPAQDG